MEILHHKHHIRPKNICNAMDQSKELRIYEKDTPQFYLYQDMHSNQTLDYVKDKKQKYSSLKNKKMTIKEALLLMDDFIDPSDPDLDVENSIHAYQTAERIRKKYPEDKELQIIGLIHDLGKVLFTLGEPSWAVVGDTYVVGCKFPESIVFYETLKGNPDYNKYNELGIYTEKCGLKNLNITFGHDEYLYQVLKENKNHKISKRYMNIIRYHSFYPWHTGGDYHQFMNESDKDTLKDVVMFNEFDLYSKEDHKEISNEIKEYYDNILDDYFTNQLWW